MKQTYYPKHLLLAQPQSGNVLGFLHSFDKNPYYEKPLS